jgi:hypothetical protein
MRTKTFLGVLLTSVVVVVSLSVAEAQPPPLPGTPLAGGSFPIVNLFDGATLLPAPVTPGDVVLREVPPVPPPDPLDRTKWSDVVRFFNGVDASGALQGYAVLVSDGETGVGNIGVRYMSLSFQNVLTNFDLPDSLNANSSFVLEGIGSPPQQIAADPTPWQVPGLLYKVHSDINEIEPTPPPKQPGAVVAGQGPANLVVVMGENSAVCDIAMANCPVVVTGIPLFPGNNTVFEADGVTFSDTINFNAAGMITLTQSDNAPGAGEEELPLVVLDEGTSMTLFVPDAPEVPEPTSIFLAAVGLIGLLVYGGCGSRWQSRFF